MKIYYSLLIFLTIFTYSCKLDKVEPLPGFIRIDTLQLDLDPNTQGTNTNNFSEAWVYVDGDLQGIYDLPAIFPTLSTGEHQVTVRPGIKRNGIASSRADHPHFENFELNNQNIGVEDTLTVLPVFQLRSGIKVWFENFEGTGFQFDNDPDADTSVTLTNNPDHVAEGSGAAEAYLDDATQFFSISTDENFQFRAGTPVFLEIDYKTTGFLDVELIVHTGLGDFTREVVFVLPKFNDSGNSIYNKIYINLAEAVSSEPSATGFDIRIKGVPDFGQFNTTYFLDNIKITYP